MAADSIRTEEQKDVPSFFLTLYWHEWWHIVFGPRNGKKFPLPFSILAGMAADSIRTEERKDVPSYFLTLYWQEWWQIVFRLRN
jgi:hypothetical protein